MAFLRWAPAVAALYLLYFYGLSRVGLIGPDETRYSAIGRQMAQSGDLVTPVLWGKPWFEKPPLLYWMTAAGFRLGLGPETAPRLPVATMSVAFLGFYWWVLRRLYGAGEALLATLMLGTCAGWLAYSYVAVTDLPMSVCFAAAMLLALGWLEGGRSRLLYGAAVAMGLAILAKGLVPIALALPLIWFARRRWREALPPALASLLVAVPWYLACYLRNGWPFIEEFIVRHHFSRVTSDALQHVQPFWFYVPVLAAGLVPWTPMLLLLSGRKLYADRKNRFLLAWALFGLLFLSLTLNKLPGYLLPLLPAVCALMGIALARAGRVRWAFAGTVVLLGLLPAIEHILPAALEEGIRRSPWRTAPWWPVLAAAPVAWLASAWVARGKRFVLTVACSAALVVAATYLKIKVLPLVDEQSTARPLASRVAQAPQQHCVEWMPRALRYGLNYYTVTPLPDCEDDPRPNPIVVLAKDQ